MSKAVNPNSLFMIGGELYVPLARSKPGADRHHRLLVHKRGEPSAVYWAVAQHNLNRGPWKIERVATLEEVELEIDLEIERVMAMPPDAGLPQPAKCFADTFSAETVLLDAFFPEKS